jgi:hypothetical protein
MQTILKKNLFKLHILIVSVLICILNKHKLSLNTLELNFYSLNSQGSLKIKNI